MKTNNIKLIYNILNPNNHPIEDDIEKTIGLKKPILFNDYVDCLGLIDDQKKYNDDYRLLKNYIRNEDYYFCAGIYNNLLTCINYKSNNKNPIKKIIRVTVYDNKDSLNSIDHFPLPDISVNVYLYNNYQIDIKGLTTDLGIDYIKYIKTLYSLSGTVIKSNNLYNEYNKCINQIRINLENVLYQYLKIHLINC